MRANSPPEINYYDPKTEENSRNMGELCHRLSKMVSDDKARAYLGTVRKLLALGTPIPLTNYGTYWNYEVKSFTLVLSRIMERGNAGKFWNADENENFRRQQLIESAGIQMIGEGGPMMWYYLKHAPTLAAVFDEAEKRAPLNFCPINPEFKEWLQANPNTKFEPGHHFPENTALHVAVGLNDKILVDKILASGISVDAVGFFEDRVISWAILMCHEELTEHILNRNPNLFELTPGKFTPAHWIAGAWIDADETKRAKLCRIWKMISKHSKNDLLVPCKILQINGEDLLPQDICNEPFKSD